MSNIIDKSFIYGILTAFIIVIISAIFFGFLAKDTNAQEIEEIFANYPDGNMASNTNWIELDWGAFEDDCEIISGQMVCAVDTNNPSSSYNFSTSTIENFTIQTKRSQSGVSTITFNNDPNTSGTLGFYFSDDEIKWMKVGGGPFDFIASSTGNFQTLQIFHNASSSKFNIYIDGEYITEKTYSGRTYGYLNFNSTNAGSILTNNYFRIDSPSPDVEIIETPDWQGQVEVGAEFNITYSDKNYCTIDEVCHLSYNYSFDSVGNKVYLLPDPPPSMSEFQSNPNAYDNNDLIDGMMLWDYFVISTSTPNRQQYCFYYVEDIFILDNNIMYCGIELLWSNDDWILQLFDECDINTACSDISTTTETTLMEGMVNAISCAFRKGIIWGFCPSDESLINFSHSVNALEKEFPFSVIDQSIYLINQNMASTSNASTTGTIPFYLYEQEDSGRWIGTTTNLNYLDFDNFKIQPFYNVWNDIMYWFEILIYLLAFVYIIFRIFNLSRQV